MPWPFDLAFMQRALVAGLVVGACAPLIGTFIVHRRTALLGEAIGHVAFAGVAAGLLVGVWPIWSALAVAVAGAVAIELLRRLGGVSGDLALSVLLFAGLASGVVIAGKAGALGSVHQYLFGAILTVSASEVWFILGLGVAIVAVLGLIGRAFIAIVIDEEGARVAGLPVDTLTMVMSILVAVTVVVAMRAVGILLVAALLVLPVATGQSIARSFRGTLVAASATGAGSVVVGLTASRGWDLAPGGSIVLVAIALFVLVATLTRGRHLRGSENPLTRH